MKFIRISKSDSHYWNDLFCG